MSAEPETVCEFCGCELNLLGGCDYCAEVDRQIHERIDREAEEREGRQLEWQVPRSIWLAYAVTAALIALGAAAAMARPAIAHAPEMIFAITVLACATEPPPHDVERCETFQVPVQMTPVECVLFGQMAVLEAMRAPFFEFHELRAWRCSFGEPA